MADLGPAGCTLAFLGVESDVKIARFMYTFLSRHFMKEALTSAANDGIKGGQKKRYVNSFIYAAGKAVFNRIYQERQASLQGENSCRALVEVKDDLVKTFLKEKYPNTTVIKSHAQINETAARNGRIAGEQVELKKALEEQRRGSIEDKT